MRHERRLSFGMGSVYLKFLPRRVDRLAGTPPVGALQHTTPEESLQAGSGLGGPTDALQAGFVCSSPRHPDPPAGLDDTGDLLASLCDDLAVEGEEPCNGEPLL